MPKLKLFSFLVLETEILQYICIVDIINETNGYKNGCHDYYRDY